MNFKELRKLSENDHPGGSLERKLERFWRTPMIDNDAITGDKTSPTVRSNLGDLFALRAGTLKSPTTSKRPSPHFPPKITLNF